MDKKCIFLLILLLAGKEVYSQPTEYGNAVKRYVETYKELAINEMNLFRIPASITLAQGIHESRAGLSRLATEANNHFGIKCHKGWTGDTLREDDDLPDDCFRKYGSPEESYRDHSLFLTQRSRYEGLFQLDQLDYKSWAKGLQSCGYATNPRYAESLIRIIETYELYRFDRTAPVVSFPLPGADLDDPEVQPWLGQFKLFALGPENRRVYINNELQMTIARRKDDLRSLSKAFDLSEKRLCRYNDLKEAGDLRPGQIVYLQPKRRKAVHEIHQVLPGETLYDISQFYGIKLKMVLKRNHLAPGIEPVKGFILKLR